MKNKHAQALGKIGGSVSAKSRFPGKNKDEIGEMMQKFRGGHKFTDGQTIVDALNKAVKNRPKI